METEIATAHEVNNEVPVRMFSIGPQGDELKKIKNRLDAHVFDVLEAVPQVADKRMINMLEHAALSNNVSYAFGSNDCTIKRLAILARRRHRMEDQILGGGGKYAYLHLSVCI